jgi:hypothetical protein
MNLRTEITCPECKRHCKNVKSLSAHLRQTHGFLKTEIQKVTRPIILLREELNINNRLDQYCSCEICGVKKKDLSSHIRSVHKLNNNSYIAQFPKATIISDYVIAKISKKKTLWWSNKTTDERSIEANKGRHGGNDPKEKSKRMKKFWESRTDEYMDSLSLKLSLAQKANSKHYGGRNYKSGKHFSDKAVGGEFWYRSSWELLFAEYLDSSPLIANYTVEPKRIIFTDFETNKKKTFCNDFEVTFLNNKKCVFEIKPSSMISYYLPRLIAQYEYALMESIGFFIVTEKTLFGNLDSFMNGVFNDNIVRTFDECTA